MLWKLNLTQCLSQFTYSRDVVVKLGGLSGGRLEIGWTSGNDGSSKVGSGSGISWVVVAGSTCCCGVACVVYSSSGEGCASDWLQSEG